MTNYLKNRHIGLIEADQKKMLQAIGAASMEQLLDETIPHAIRLEKPLDLPQALSEQEHMDMMAHLAGLNKPYKNFIGRGWYGTNAPAVIARNMLENPVWYTSYTP